MGRKRIWPRGGARARSSLLATVLGVLALASPAPAHRGDAHTRDAALSPAEREAAIGERAELAGDRLYRVPVGDGETAVTHGPDLPPPSGAGSRSVTGPIAGAPERPPVCSSQSYQHVLVAHLVGAPDRAGDVAEEVRASIRRMNWVLNEAATASGDTTADYRVLCDASGAIRVDSFASPSPAFEDVIRSAREAGFAAPGANYTIFFDSPLAGGGCGMGSYRRDDRLVAENRNNLGGGYAVTYQPCWQGATPMHESAHTMGAVQPGAPNGTGSGGHCNQTLDVVCYTPDGGDRNQDAWVSACTGERRFDCGDDDYFDAAPEPGEYLETHWNLGSPLNRFIAFGEGPPPAAEPENTLPAAPQPSAPCSSEACAQRLRLGVSSRGTAHPALYRLRVPRGSVSLRVSASAAGQLRLSFRRGAAPRDDSWDCRIAPGSSRPCRIRGPRSGRWYVAVVADEVGPNDFELLAEANSRREDEQPAK